MLSPLPPEHPFSGILVRLQRADENIFNLGTEISRFFQECKYPVMPNPNDKEWDDAINYHRSLGIPKRFSVLTGEIVHHWRSCLDHIVWMGSNSAYRKAHETEIQFPILNRSPDPNATKRLERQIGGLPNPGAVRELILKFQPYNLGGDAWDSPLSIIHHMDIVDKHRELVIVQTTGSLILPPSAPPEVFAVAAAYGDNKPISEIDRSSLHRALCEQGKVFPQVAFAQFGKWKNQFVLPSLYKLASSIEEVIAIFMAAMA